MKKTPEGQLARKLSGMRGEKLVKNLLMRDPTVRKRYHVYVSTSKGKVPGLDVKLNPISDFCLVNKDDPRCRPVEMEVKSVEKLFERDDARQWPHNRDSRFVLKKSEKPDCYVFVADDELTGHSVVDIVDSKRVLKWMERLRPHAKSPKLPVRALPELRSTPCRYVSKSHQVIKRLKVK